MQSLRSFIARSANFSWASTRRLTSSLKGRALSRRSTLVLSFIGLPWTVQALPWSKAKPKAYEDPNCMEAKLFNKEDQSLIQDLKAADQVYVTSNGLTHQEVYDKLSKHRGKKEAELLWRLGRVTYELSKTALKSDDKVRLVEEAYHDLQQALEVDETNFAAHKWMAIVLNERSTMKGVKEQITQSYNVREHMEKAAKFNPKDPTSTYLIGNWCFTVAEIPWYQKKVAETIFAKPPSCSFGEAVQYFLQAENLQPLFYSMNLLMLAKSYMKLGELDKAEQYLVLLNGTPLTTDEDILTRKEGNDLLSKIQKSKGSSSPKDGDK